MSPLLTALGKELELFSFVFTETIYTTKLIVYYSDNLLNHPFVRLMCCWAMGFIDSTS